MKFKRIIFNLFYDEGFFCLSRNFFLQKVGDLNWIKKTFGFENLCNHVDELIVTLTTLNPTQKQINSYLKDVENLKKNFFLPIALSGGIKNLDDAKMRFNSGADKIIVNSLVHLSTDKVNLISDKYGSQAVIISCDYIKENNKYLTAHSKAKLISFDIDNFLKKIKKVNYGELLLNSVEKDGTGQGFDKKIIKYLEKINRPIIVMGGAGKIEHFLEVLKNKNIDAAATGNLFNFLGDGLKITRLALIKKKINLVNFS